MQKIEQNGTVTLVLTKKEYAEFTQRQLLDADAVVRAFISASNSRIAYQRDPIYLVGNMIEVVVGFREGLHATATSSYIDIKTYDALKAAGYVTIRQLLKATEAEIKTVKGVGEKGVEALKRALRFYVEHQKAKPNTCNLFAL